MKNHINLIHKYSDKNLIDQRVGTCKSINYPEMVHY